MATPPISSMAELVRLVEHVPLESVQTETLPGPLVSKILPTAIFPVVALGADASDGWPYGSTIVPSNGPHMPGPYTFISRSSTLETKKALGTIRLPELSTPKPLTDAVGLTVQVDGPLPALFFGKP